MNLDTPITGRDILGAGLLLMGIYFTYTGLKGLEELYHYSKKRRA